MRILFPNLLSIYHYYGLFLYAIPGANKFLPDNPEQNDASRGRQDPFDFQMCDNYLK